MQNLSDGSRCTLLETVTNRRQQMIKKGADGSIPFENLWPMLTFAQLAAFIQFISSL